MNGFKSRKFVQTMLAELGILGYMFYAKPEGQILIICIAALVSLALGYNLTNAWQGRAAIKNGKEPEA